MHEVRIANSVLMAVRTESARYPGCVPRRVGLGIGELTAIDADALRFCFEALTRDTDFGSLQLEIEICPRSHCCPACGQEFVFRNYEQSDDKPLKYPSIFFKSELLILNKVDLLPYVSFDIGAAVENAPRAPCDGSDQSFPHYE
jgi:Zn finger protein HypA/HybF involved in hydrogenase expression